ncbi:MAG: tetratricopeptide repeat protein [Phycisphaerae bacterium]
MSRDFGGHCDSPHDALGFQLDDESWLSKVRTAQRVSDGPRWIGPYLLRELIGQGGQGLVYRATQPGTGREVALKRLSAGVFATPEMRARFEREVEAAAALDHPCVVTVYGTETIDGQPVLVMQWIDGLPVDRWTHIGGPRSRDDRLALFARICEAIQHAHQRGVIHRDLKPANILVDGLDLPHVLDFGLSRMLSSDQRNASLTATGIGMGTPAYAAPEQLLDARAAGDVRADIYSLGVILYQLLTERTPYEETSTLRELLDAHERDRPPSPARFAPIGQELSAIVLKAIAREPSKRYASVEAFSNDLARYRAGSPVLAVRPSRWYYTRKFVRRNFGAVALSGLMLSMLVAAAVISTAMYFQADAARALSQENETRAERALATAESFTRLLRGTFAAADRAEQRGDPDVTVRQAMDNVVAELRRASEQYDPDAVAETLTTIASVYVELDEHARAAPLLDEALSIRRKTTGESSEAYATTLQWVAVCDLDRGEIESAISKTEVVKRIRHTSGDTQTREYASIVRQLGLLYKTSGDFARAEQLYREALDVQRAVLATGDADVGITLTNLCIVVRASGRLEDALELAKQAHAFYERHFPAEHPGRVEALRALAMAYKAVKNCDRAIELGRAALTATERLRGKDNRVYADYAGSLATALDECGRQDEAEPLYREALAIFEARSVRDDLKRATAANNLGALLCAKREYQQAIARFAEALDVRVTVLGSENATVAESLHNIGATCRLAGDLGNAADYLRHALAMRRQSLGNAHPATAGSVFGLSLIEGDCGYYEQAESLCREALAMRLASLPRGSSLICSARLALASVLIRLGEFGEAEWHCFLAWDEVDPDAASAAKDRSRIADKLAQVYDWCADRTKSDPESAAALRIQAESWRTRIETPVRGP